jgi:hypothetical protein
MLDKIVLFKNYSIIVKKKIKMNNLFGEKKIIMAV